jgi:homoserine kinase
VDKPADAVTAFAPASVGNVAVGFDVLGFAVDALGDLVSVARSRSRGVTIREVSGVAGNLPRDPDQNAAGRALLAIQAAERADFGFDVWLEKGIPLGSGLGGSAASAVAAVVAANALLPKACSGIELLKFALQGELAASGSTAVDNVSASLFGGLVLTVGEDREHVKHIPVPEGLRAVVVHPHLFLSTRQARSILKPAVELADFVRQTANLAGFIAGCYTNDLDLIRECLDDVVIEPQRAALVPGFADAKAAALQAGALGCSISGAGPATFAWTLETKAEAVARAMIGAFAREKLAADHWVVRMDSAGARILER